MRNRLAALPLLPFGFIVLVALATPVVAQQVSGEHPVFGILANGHIATVAEWVKENPTLVKAKNKQGKTLLNLAADGSGKELVELLLKQGADVNARDNDGQTALHRAAASEQKSVNVVDVLLAHGAELNATDLIGFSPLYYARLRSNGPVVQRLEARGAHEDGTAFMEALRYGDRDTVSRLLTSTPSWVRAGSPLQIAVKAGDVEMASLLIGKGADVNYRDPKTKSPLLFDAIATGRKALVSLVLEHGTVGKGPDSGPLSALELSRALELARSLEQYSVVPALLAKGAVPGQRSGGLDQSNTLLEDAAARGNDELVRLLLDSGTDINRGGPLQKAIAAGHRSTIAMLLKRGAAINAEGDDPLGRGALHIAALRGENDYIELLLQAGADPNDVSHNPEGETPLELAVKSGLAPLGASRAADLLLQKGARIEGEGNRGARLLHQAIAHQNRLMVELLQRHGARFGGSPIFDAVLARDATLVAALLAGDGQMAQVGSDKEIRETQGTTPLHLAALLGLSDVTELLIAKGANIKASTQAGVTPLHNASHAAAATVVATLLQNGAEVTAADKLGRTPLHIAAASGTVPIVAMLLDRGAEINAKTRSGLVMAIDHGAGLEGRVTSLRFAPLVAAGSSPLQVAARAGNKEVVALILERGGDTKAAGAYKDTSLHEAVRSGSRDTVALLLEKGADANALGRAARTPLHEAIFQQEDSYLINAVSGTQDSNTSEGRQRRYWKEILTPYTVAPSAREIISLLLEKGADPTLYTNNYWNLGVTPLDEALRGNDKELVSQLIDKVSDLGVKGVFGATLLHRAAFFGNKDAAELLLGKGADVNAEDFAGRTALDEARGTYVANVNYGLDGSAFIRPPADELFLERRKAVADLLARRGGRIGRDHFSAAIETANVFRTREALRSAPDLARAGNSTLGLAVARAASKKKAELLTLLLENGIDVNTQDSMGDTALHAAARSGDVAMATLLLGRGANINAWDENGKTPLELAAVPPQVNGVRDLLLARGARSGVNLTAILREGQEVDLKSFFAEHPNIIKHRGSSGKSMLHRAVEWKNLALVNLLLENGADINAADHPGVTALYTAVNKDDAVMAKLLLDKGANAKLATKQGWTPLHSAVIRSKELVKLLLDYGAPIDAKNERRRTPLMLAVESKKDEIAELLRQRGAKN